MKLTLKHLVIIGALLTAVFTAVARADAQEQSWYNACAQYQNDYVAYSLCTTMQNPYVHPCAAQPKTPNGDEAIDLGAFDAINMYRCVIACQTNSDECEQFVEKLNDVPVSDYVAPNGSTWRENFYHNDLNRVKAEACVVCLKTARNRKSCKGC